MENKRGLVPVQAAECLSSYAPGAIVNVFPILCSEKKDSFFLHLAAPSARPCFPNTEAEMNWTGSVVTRALSTSLGISRALARSRALSTIQKSAALVANTPKSLTCSHEHNVPVHVKKIQVHMEIYMALIWIGSPCFERKERKVGRNSMLRKGKDDLWKTVTSRSVPLT